MRINRTEVTTTDVILVLENGVTIHISPHEKYVHLSFSGIRDVPGRSLLVASLSAHMPGIPALELPNYIDIEYTPSKES